MRLVYRYLVSRYLLGCLPVILALTALFSFLVLAEELEDVGKGLYETEDALLVALLTLPARILELLPVTLLLGGLLGLGGLARDQEIIALRALGFATSRLARPLLGVASGAVLLIVAMRFWVLPDFEWRAAQLRAKTQAAEFHRDYQAQGYWMRTGDQLLHIGRLVDGHGLRDIEVYQLSEQGQVTGLLRAAAGEIQAGRQWRLSGVQQWDFASWPPTKDSSDALLWASRLNEQQTASLVVPLEARSPVSLWRYIRLLDASGLDSHRQWSLFWQQISSLAGVFIMAMLVLPFILGSQRHGALGRSAVIGIALGLGFYLLEQLTGQMAALLGLAPFMAAWLPEAVMAALAWRLVAKPPG